VLRSAGLLGLTVAAFLVIVAPASAKETHVFAPPPFAGPGAGPGQLSLEAHSGVAINQTTGDLYVADTGNARVSEFEADGTFVRSFGTFTTPTFVAVDNAPGGEGDVYVADTTTNTVSKFEADGTPITSWGSGGQLSGTGSETFEGFGGIMGIAVEPSGGLVVLAGSLAPGHLLKFTSAGAFTSEAETPRGSVPYGLAVDPAGNFFKVNGNGTVEELGPTGADIGQITSNFTTTALAVDPTDGDLYVDQGESISRYAFNGAGEVLEPGAAACPVVPEGNCEPADSFGSIEAAGGELQRGAGLAVTAAATVYLADSGRARQRLDVFTAAVLPDVVTLPAAPVGPQSAVLNGTVNPAKAGAATCAFAWGTTAALGQTAPCAAPIAEGEAPVPVEAELTGLQPDTTYFFRLQATNSQGTNPGAPAQTMEFTTPGPGLHGLSVTEVSADSATLGATIDPHGAPTSYRFEYDTAPYAEGGPAHGTSVPFPDAAIGSGTADVEVSRSVQGLLAATTYYFRVVATSELEPGVFQSFAAPEGSFATQVPGALVLPDARQWQLVSPPDKLGGLIQHIGPGSGVFQAAADGSAITYVANAPTEPSPPAYPGVVNVLSTRGAAGWSSRDIPTPHTGPTTGRALNSPEDFFFSPDLSSTLVQPYGLFEAALSSEASEQTPYLRTLGACQTDCFRPLFTAASAHQNAPSGFGEEAECEQGTELTALFCGPLLLGAAPDLAHAVVLSAAPLIPGDGREQLYEWSQGMVRPVSLLPPEGAGEEIPAPEGTARLGANFGGLAQAEIAAKRAISTDGSRVFWTEGLGGVGTRTPKRLFLRDTTTEKSLQLDAAEPACLTAGECQSGLGLYQIASIHGSRVFFTDANRLTSDSGAGNGHSDLYECRIGEAAGRPTCALTDLTPANGGEPAGVLGNVLGASEDGSDVYFVADGVLASNQVEHGGGAEAAAPGTCALENAPPGATCNLYLSHDGTTTFIATLSGADNFDWRFGAEEQPVRVSPDGRWLSFMSEAPLTGYDNRDAASPGHRDAEVYLYDSATGRLTCPSCNPSGARPHGVSYGSLSPTASEALIGGQEEWPGVGWVAAVAPPSVSFNARKSYYQPRYLSDSGRIFFNAVDALSPQDVNQTSDVYESEPVGVGSCGPGASGYQQTTARCLALISSGTSGRESGFLDASESGADVFFETSARLAPQDVDSARDVYDAHECLGAGAADCFPPPPPSPPACEGDACQQPAAPPAHPTPGTALLDGPGNVLQCPKGKTVKKGKCVKKQQKSKKKNHKKKAKNKKKGGGKKQKRAAGHNGGGHK
jgi:DNA-binding beta-propeller fold protein YncE